MIEKLSIAVDERAFAKTETIILGHKLNDLIDQSNANETAIAELAEKVRVHKHNDAERWANRWRFMEELAERVESNRKRLRCLDGGSNRNEDFVVGEMTRLAVRVEALEEEANSHIYWTPSQIESAKAKAKELMAYFKEMEKSQTVDTYEQVPTNSGHSDPQDRDELKPCPLVNVNYWQNRTWKCDHMREEERLKADLAEAQKEIDHIRSLWIPRVTPPNAEVQTLSTYDLVEAAIKGNDDLLTQLGEARERIARTKSVLQEEVSRGHISHVASRTILDALTDSE